jgi:RHS repeat-associated protein
VQWTGSTLPAPEPPTNAWRRLTYTYDPSGRRIAKSYDGELITSYVYDGDNCIAEYDINSNLKRKYIYGPGVDQPICMMEATASPAATYYYHFDALGSVVALTNSSGNTVEVYEYSVFGQVGASDANHPNRFMFTGREFDKETGLYYYRARYYNPQIGRFLQTDPVGYGAGMNLYRYCRNNPLGLMDPSGCDPCDPCDANQTPSPVPYGPSSGEPVITPEDIASGDLMGVLGKIAATPATILGGAVRMAQAILADIASHTEVAFYVVGQNGIVVPVKVFQSRSKVNGVPGLKDVAMNLGNEIHIGPEMAADLLTEAALRRSVGQVGVATPITWGGPTGTNYEQTMAHELGHQVDADRMGILYPLIGGIATLNQTSDFEQRASNLGEYYGLLFPSEAKALGLI